MQQQAPDDGAAPASNKKRPWVPPKFVQEALGCLPLTKDGEHPNKRFYRSRAHCNPLSHNDAFEYPPHPSKMDWSQLYPEVADPTVRFLDVGCGFGGLTVALSGLFPDKVVLALEIRAKVCEFVRLRIEEMRKEVPARAQNAAVLKTNAMKYLPHFFRKGQLEKIFFCFPDPHFKAKNHRRRIVSEVRTLPVRMHAHLAVSGPMRMHTHPASVTHISPPPPQKTCARHQQRLLTEYAYLLGEGSLLYAITDGTYHLLRRKRTLDATPPHGKPLTLRLPPLPH